MSGRRLLLSLAAAIAALAVALVAAVAADDRQLQPAVDPGAASHLLGPLGPGRALDGAFTWREPEVDGSQIRLVLSDRPTPGGPELAVIALRPVWLATGDEGLVSHSFTITATAPPDAGPQIQRHLDDAVQHIRRTDNGRFYRERPFGYWLAPSFELAALLALLAIWLAVIAVRRGAEVSATTRFKATHLLVAGLHVTFLTYWGLHWDGVAEYVPMVLAQLAFAYLADACIALHTDGRWDVTFGPVPIVGSTTLFVWFRGLDAWLGFLVIFLALASKAWVRRDGRHIFNPSAIGISVVALMCLAAPGALHYIDISRQLNLPPNMLEVVLVAAIVAQLRVPIVTISIAAYGVMYLLWNLGIRAEQAPFWPPVFLAIALLVTDPATAPRTGGGRALYGIAYGVAVSLFDVSLATLGASTFFAKVLPVPIVNWFVPWFDRVGARLPTFLQEHVLAPRLNRVQIVAWLALMVATFGLGDVKKHSFLGDLQLAQDTRLIRTDWNGAATCKENPAFCRPFAVAEEARRWSEVLAGVE